MTSAAGSRLLSALAAVLAPAGAARLLARVAHPDPERFRAEASRLAAAPRAARIAALGRALAAAGDLPPGARLTVRLPPLRASEDGAGPVPPTAPRPMVRPPDHLGEAAEDGGDLISGICETSSGGRAVARPVESEPA